ncbi:hypothetical protein LEP1GSC060_1604 [Leptospira weilii serovar Ranarum str. ICFT]|uniref:Uncharacterized protein n=1 Tax=Leptospira weilii serovar Ranarum str. ICFT TaxID=1218598 RepID=N1WGV9_9LEPT|nr:hypothetical protein LEP1GSC060_1604 [Leptospira weilii serovar Ranarum str. ICFT]
MEFQCNREINVRLLRFDEKFPSANPRAAKLPSGSQTIV